MPKLTRQYKPGGAGCLASTARLEYDGSGNLKKRIEFDGSHTDFVHDEARKLLLSKSEASTQSIYTRVSQTQWHDSLPLPLKRATAKLLTTYQYDSRGNLLNLSEQATLDNNGTQGFAAVTTGEARNWTYTYNSQNQVLTATGPRLDKPDTTFYTYDPQGNLSSITNSVGHVTLLDQYTLDGDVGRITSPNGSITSLSYNPLRQLARVAISDGKTELVTQYHYDAAGQLTRIKLPDSSQLNYVYDDAHRLIKVLDVAGNSINYTYDAASKLIKEDVQDASNNLLQISRRSYDVLDRLTQVQHGLFDSATPGQGYATNYEYDSRDRLTKITDALQNVTEIFVDPLGRVKRTTLPEIDNFTMRSSIFIDNDGQDRVKNVTDPRDLNTSYEVDGLGRQTKQSSPDTGVENYQTDLAGNLTQKTDARGITSKFSYDALGRLTGISFPSSTSSLSYDIGSTAKGKLSRIMDSSGRTLWQYDGFGRTVQKDQVITVGGQETLLRQQTRFDANGKASQLTYPSGISFLYSYAVDGKLQAVTLLNKDGSRTPLLKEMQHRPFGGLQSWLWGNHTALSANSYSRGYDQAGRIKFYPLGNALAGGVQRSLRFDDANRLIAYTHTGSANASLFDQNFAYDGMARLISASSNGSSLGYAYDASNNRTALTIGGNRYQNAIEPRSNRLSSSTGPMPAANNTYDKSGNLLSDGSITYTYGENGRLQSAKRGNLTSLYIYNAQGQRVAKQVMTVGTGNKTLYAYDDAGHVIGEYDGSGNPIQETVFIGDMPVAVLVPQAATPGKPAVHYVYTDHLNTPRLISRASDNKIVWRWLGLGPFGENLPEENPMGLGVFTYNLRFPGQMFDVETGLHQNYYREYNPQTARYSQSDPIGLTGGINTYSYVLGNPISNIDPDGLETRVVPCPFGICPPPSPNSVNPVAVGAGNPLLADGDDRSREREGRDSGRIRSPAIPSDNYHKICDQREPPGLDKCASAKFRLNRAQACLTARDAFAQTHHGGTYDAGHAQQMAELRNAIKNAEKDVRRFCKDQCP